MPNRLHALLATVALIAWALFILACTGASWSPDGTKILFSYADPAARQSGIAYYDVNTGTTSTLFLRASDKSGGTIAFAQWERDGSRALIFTLPGSGTSEFSVLAMPVGSSGTTRQFSLPPIDELTPGLPYPEINGQLFIDGKYLARLNLETGQVKLADAKSKDVKLLFSDGARLFFVRQGAEKGTLTVGEVNQETLKRQPLFQFDLKAVREAGIAVDTLWPVPALDPHGGMIALIAMGDSKDAIVLCSLQGFERAFWPDLPLDNYMLSALEWSQDGHTLYGSALSRTSESTILYFAEIPADGSRGRVTEVTRLSAGTAMREWRGLLRLPLSPDGRTIAVSLADFGSDRDQAMRALYLVKLNDSDRRVTVVRPPHAEYLPNALPDDPEDTQTPPPPPPEAHP